MVNTNLKFMRNFLYLIVLVIIICAMQCASKKNVVVDKNQEQKDIERLLPPVPSSFSHADSVRLIHNWTIGIRLYKNNCSKCHGVFGNGKDTISNFTKAQFDDYKSAYLAGDSTNHAVMAKMTQEELNDVFLLLIDLKRETHL